MKLSSSNTPINCLIHNSTTWVYETHLSHQFQIAVWFSSSYYMYMPLGIDDFFSWRITWTLSKNMLENLWLMKQLPSLPIHFSTPKSESSATYFSHLLLQGLRLEFLKNKNFLIFLQHIQQKKSDEKLKHGKCWI